MTRDHARSVSIHGRHTSREMNVEAPSLGIDPFENANLKARADDPALRRARVSDRICKVGSGYSHESGRRIRRVFSEKLNEENGFTEFQLGEHA